jgi:hypothetical protein
VNPGEETSLSKHKLFIGAVMLGLTCAGTTRAAVVHRGATN